MAKAYLKVWNGLSSFVTDGNRNDEFVSSQRLSTCCWDISFVKILLRITVFSRSCCCKFACSCKFEEYCVSTPLNEGKDILSAPWSRLRLSFL